MHACRIVLLLLHYFIYFWTIKYYIFLKIIQVFGTVCVFDSSDAGGVSGSSGADESCERGQSARSDGAAHQGSGGRTQPHTQRSAGQSGSERLQSHRAGTLQTAVQRRAASTQESGLQTGEVRGMIGSLSCHL